MIPNSLALTHLMSWYAMVYKNAEKNFNSYKELIF